MVGNLKYTAYYYILSALLCYCMAGCSEVELDSSRNEEGKLYHFQITGLPTMTQNIPLPSMHAYAFVQGVLLKAYNNIAVESDGVVEVPALENSTIYFFSGVTAGTGLDELVEGKSLLSDFLNMNTPALAENAEPELFYSGKTDENVTNEVMGKHVSLTPGVARINLKIKNNADIKVTKIILDNVSGQTPLFASGDRPATFTVPRTIEFPDGGIGDKEGIFHLYEYGSSMTMVVHALYHGVPSVRKVAFPPIQRGFQYTLTLADIGTTTESTIVTEPLTDGGTVDATDTERIYLYPNNTNGTISGDTLTVTDGSNYEVMSFLAPFGVSLNIVEGSQHVSEVVEAGTTNIKGMKLTTYGFRLSNLTLPPGSSGKSIKVSVQSNEANPPAAQEFYLKILPGTVNRQSNSKQYRNSKNTQKCISDIIPSKQPFV